MGWGYCLILLPVGLVIFFLSYMPRKYKKEMARLEKRFGESYRDYAAGIHSLLPSLRPYPKADTRKWSFSLFWKENREQYFILIVATVSAGIAAKYFL
jgi:hypothetical protein